MTDTPTTFATVKWGTKYSADYVNILRDMLRRNLPKDFQFNFLCFTDDPSGLLSNIETRPLPPGLTGWWNKLYLFKQSVFTEGTHVFFLDLDTAITGDIAAIASYRGEFAILRDFYKPAGFNSSLMLWRSGFGHSIWQSYEEAGRPDITGGDQAWIERCNPKADILQDLFPGMIVSFKEKAQLELPSGVRVVCFHGLPRPHQVKNGWVEKIWKIGGATPAATAAPPAAAEPIENVRHALTLSFPWLDTRMTADAARQVCVVGGGASAESGIEELKKRQQDGCAIWALDGAFQKLAAQDIEADAHVMASAGAENAGYVPEQTKATLLYASQCHPLVFEKAAQPPKRVILWHPQIDGIRSLTGEQNALFIGGGGTTGMRAITLAQALGFGRIHLYGFDSSFPAGAAVETSAAANDDERRIEVHIDGLSFASSPRLAQQVNDFRLLQQSLMPKGVRLSVQGDGLLPYVARKLAKLNAR